MSDSEYEYIDVPLRLKVPKKTEGGRIIPLIGETETRPTIIQRAAHSAVIIAITSQHEAGGTQPNIQISSSSADKWGVDPEVETGTVFQAKEYSAAETLLSMSGGGLWQPRGDEGRGLPESVIEEDVEAALLDTNLILAPNTFEFGGGSKTKSELFIVGNGESGSGGLGNPEVSQVGSTQESRFVCGGQQQDILNLEERSPQFINWKIGDLGIQSSWAVGSGEASGGQGAENLREDDLMNTGIINNDRCNPCDGGREPMLLNETGGVRGSLRPCDGGGESQFFDFGQDYDEQLNLALADDSVDLCQFLGFESTGFAQAHRDLEITEDDLQIQQIVNSYLQAVPNNNGEYFLNDYQVDGSILEEQYEVGHDPQSLIHSQKHDLRGINSTVPSDVFLGAGYMGTDNPGAGHEQIISYRATGAEGETGGDLMEDAYARAPAGAGTLCICQPPMWLSYGFSSCPVCSINKNIESGHAGAGSNSDAETIRVRTSLPIQAEAAPQKGTEDCTPTRNNLLHYDSGPTQSPMQMSRQRLQEISRLDPSPPDRYPETGGATSPQTALFSNPTNTNEGQADYAFPLTGNFQTASCCQQERLFNPTMSEPPMHISEENTERGTPSYTSLFGDYSSVSMNEFSANDDPVNTFFPLPEDLTGFVSDVMGDLDTDMESEEPDEISDNTEDGEGDTPRESDNMLSQVGEDSSIDSDLEEIEIEQVVAQDGTHESMNGTEDEDDKNACDYAMTDPDDIYGSQSSPVTDESTGEVQSDLEIDRDAREGRQEAEDGDYDGDNSDQEMQDNGSYDFSGWSESSSSEVTQERASRQATSAPQSFSDTSIYVPPPTPGRVSGLSLMSQSRFRVGDTPPGIDDRACWIGGVLTDMSTRYPDTDEISSDQHTARESSNPPSTVVYKGGLTKEWTKSILVSYGLIEDLGSESFIDVLVMLGRLLRDTVRGLSKLLSWRRCVYISFYLQFYFMIHDSTGILLTFLL